MIGEPLLWAADFDLGNRTIRCECTMSGIYQCSDLAVMQDVQRDLDTKAKTSPIDLAPPMGGLLVDWRDPQSMAAAMYWSIFDRYVGKIENVTFYGTGYLVEEAYDQPTRGCDAGGDGVKRVDGPVYSTIDDSVQKALRINWKDHPMHSVHDAIVEHYQPLIATALRGSVTGTAAAIEAVRQMMKKAAASEQQRAIIDAISQSVQINRSQLNQVLRQMIADSAVSGSHAAATQIGPGGQMIQGLGAEATSINWSTWEPGWAAAADLAEMDGIAKLLEASNIVINGMDATDMTKLGNIIADGLDSGTPSLQIASTISDQMDNVDNIDSRAYLIATTEVSRAMSAATEDTYAQNEIAQWEWLAQTAEDGEADDRVCEDCLDRDGETYDVGGDDSLPPQHPRCRCVMLPVVNAPTADDGSSDDSTDESSSGDGSTEESAIDEGSQG